MTPEPCGGCPAPELVSLADVLADRAHRRFMATGDPYERGFADALTIIIDAGVSMLPWAFPDAA